MKYVDARYIGSFPSVEKVPEDHKPAYAFIGRSNVGKSSLINSLTGKKKLAHVSKSPGKTQSINYFVVEDKWYIVDLPGYGYAKRSKKQRHEWRKMIERYLELSSHLICTMVLLDLRHPLQDVDRDFIDWLGKRAIPFVIVYTKADKIKPPLIPKHIDVIEQSLLEQWEQLPQHFVTSSVEGKGTEEILNFVHHYNEDYWSQRQL